MLTEPIGPRSPDDILAVVYQRTERARRRRRQQVSAAAAVLAFGVAGLVSLRPGDDEASRVRVVDRQHTRTEESTDASMPPTTAAPAAGTGTAAAARSKPRPNSSSGRPEPGKGDAARTSATTVPPLPTTTTLPVSNAPDVKSLAQASDTQGDSVLPGWYYDIVSGSMELDMRSRVVVFTTQYASPQGASDRDDRTLRSEFEYESDYVIVDVSETDNQLGTVRFDGTTACPECTKSFDAAGGVLTVSVPFAVMDSYLKARFGNGPSIEQTAVSALHLVTTSAELGVRADDTEGAP